MLDLEKRSFNNMVRWYSRELRHIHETGRKPSTISYVVARRLVRKGALTTVKDGGRLPRYYVVTERAVKVLKELKKLGNE